MAEADPSASLTLPTDRYFNRELSWLAFNQRVLEEAADALSVDFRREPG